MLDHQFQEMRVQRLKDEHRFWLAEMREERDRAIRHCRYWSAAWAVTAGALIAVLVNR